MRSVFICTSIVIVVSSVFSQQPLVRYSETLKKAVPHHYDHDKENADGRLDKIARGHKIEPYQPPLRPHKEIPWLRWVHEGRWAAQANKNTELHKVRARLLEEKLKPNHFVFKPHINPQLKPRLKQKGNARTKREVGETEKVHKKIDIKANVRNKRDIMMPQLLPEMIMQPHLEAKIPQSSDQFKGRVKESDKREKRQIVYFINRPPQLFARSPRTTPNPFIRDTHIDEYDIIRPEVGEREGMIPTIESGRSDLGSYPLVNEEATEFSKIISQFYLTTSDEHWPEIQQFADNILKPLSQLRMKKKELSMALESIKNTDQSSTVTDGPHNNVLYVSKASSLREDNDLTHKRVKRRVNKTLQRKRAKKKKQRLRRFERKRLRMLTHARRVRRQQKSKQARLQRHYARMNMSTTATPEHLRNQTLTREAEVEHNDETRSKDEETEEGDEDYESSEYEDESEDSKSERTDESNIQVSKGSQEESGESDRSGTEESEIGGKPDYGNDDYEDYEDESDDEYEDEYSSEEETEKKKKKGGKEKKLEGMMKSGRTHTLQMLNKQKYLSQRVKSERNKMNKETTFSKEKPHYFNGNKIEKKEILYKENFHRQFGKNNQLSPEKQSLPLHHDKTQINEKYFEVNMGNRDLKMEKQHLNEQSAVRDNNVHTVGKESQSNRQWRPELKTKRLINKGQLQI